MLTRFLICIIALMVQVHGNEPDPYVEALVKKRFLSLQDGTEILISSFLGKDESIRFRIFIRKKGVVLWDKSFTNELDELWYAAHFIPVTENTFIEDLNDDGYPEIGIAVWGGGNASWASRALIFSVKNGQLEFLKKQNINIEYSRSVYKTKADFNNPNFKCTLCSEK